MFPVSDQCSECRITWDVKTSLQPDPFTILTPESTVCYSISLLVSLGSMKSKEKLTLWSILLHGSKAKAFNWSNRNTSTSVKGINSQSISTNIITLLGKLLNLNYWWLDVQNLGETHVNRVVRISIWASDLHNISREKHKLYQERKIAG